jgi:hypothetical protein
MTENIQIFQLRYMTENIQIFKLTAATIFTATSTDSQHCRRLNNDTNDIDSKLKSIDIGCECFYNKRKLMINRKSCLQNGFCII